MIVSQVAWIKSDTKAILAIHNHVITNNARLDITHNDKVKRPHINSIRVWKRKGLSLKMQNIAKMRQIFDLNVRNSVSAKSSKGLRFWEKIKMSMKQFTVSQKLKLVHSYSHNFLWKHMNLRLAHILTKCLVRLTNR